MKNACTYESCDAQTDTSTRTTGIHSAISSSIMSEIYLRMDTMTQSGTRCTHHFGISASASTAAPLLTRPRHPNEVDTNWTQTDRQCGGRMRSGRAPFRWSAYRAFLEILLSSA
jgi:hypothetical protein